MRRSGTRLGAGSKASNDSARVGTRLGTRMGTRLGTRMSNQSQMSNKLDEGAMKKKKNEEEWQVMMSLKTPVEVVHII